MTAVLITGAFGRLGVEISKLFNGALKPTKSELDIRMSESVNTYFSSHKIKTVIHLAAMTDIRKCEDQKELAWLTNVIGTINLIRACEKYAPNCYFLYMSTPCVFSGKEGNYDEDSIPNPGNFYGLTKLSGEIAVMSSTLKYVIIRGNFVPRVPWSYPNAFVDRFGTYLFADELVHGIKDVLDSKLGGIVHVTGDKKMSMFELAKITTPDIRPMTLKDYHGPPLTVDMSLTSKRWKTYKISSN